MMPLGSLKCSYSVPRVTSTGVGPRSGRSRMAALQEVLITSSFRRCGLLFWYTTQGVTSSLANRM